MSLTVLEDSRVGTLNAEQLKLTGNVRADTDRLLKLTGNLLNVAQMESGQIQLTLKPVVPADIVPYATNALPHSPNDSTLEVSATSVLATNKIEFRVRNYGTRVRPEHQVHVVDRYVKAPGRNGQAGGTGPGLAIASEFIQSIHEQIGLNTDVTDGAPLYFSLPVVIKDG